MLLSISINIMFILSVTPLFWGVYGVVFFRTTPHFLQNSSNSFLQNSQPLSILNTFIFFSIWFSTKALNSLNLWKTSDFFLRKYIHVFLEKSSINYTYHTKLPSDGTDTSPNTSLHTSSNIPFTLLAQEGKLTWFCFPYTQCS